jgi:hypothetical protein
MKHAMTVRIMKPSAAGHPAHNSVFFTLACARCKQTLDEQLDKRKKRDLRGDLDGHLATR